ncbi:hypothetical protein [Roseateles sp. MS654]|uniref:hypothetical protein n=1 Tax=Roseateles sp. MS654 TaxID=3412685 RepID=UPI003C2E66FF
MEHNTRAARGIALIAAVAVPLNATAACGFVKAFLQPDEGGSRRVQVFRGDPVSGLEGARPLLFITSLKVNTDGTKISYHQSDVTGRRCAENPGANPCAINNIRNAFLNHKRPEADFEAVRDAGFPVNETWNVLSASIIEKDKKTGKPCVSTDGFLVSMTADVAVDGGFSRQGDCDQAKWIDALSVPALVVPGQSKFQTLGVAKRSVVVALSPSSSKRVVAGIVGDVGPSDELGEATVAMNRSLNGLPESELPKHRLDATARFQAGRTAVLVFPGAAARLARPITPTRVAEAGADALTKFGGMDKLYDCIRDEVDASF